jgi:16S rRNA processing protein RimM
LKKNDAARGPHAAASAQTAPAPGRSGAAVPVDPQSPMPTPDLLKSRGLVLFGRIVGPHGLHGALRLRTGNSEAAPDLVARLFVEHDGAVGEHRVRSSARAGRGSLKLELEGIGTIEQAQALRGAPVYVAVSDLPPTSEREFYYYQVVGLRVETTAGRLIGNIDEVFFNGANDVWVVKNGPVEVLIPVIDDVVRRIDLEGGRVVIEAVPGLLA